MDDTVLDTAKIKNLSLGIYGMAVIYLIEKGDAYFNLYNPKGVCFIKSCKILRTHGTPRNAFT